MTETAFMLVSVVAPIGGLQVSRQAATSHLGAPEPEYGALVTVRGSEYATPEYRNAYQIRSQLLGMLPYPVSSIAMDPNRRYFVFLDSNNGDVYLQDISAMRSPPNLLASSGTIGALSTAESLELIAAAPDGRRCLIVGVDGGKCVFYDVENDATFDGGMFYSHADYLALELRSSPGHSNFAVYSQAGDF